MAKQHRFGSAGGPGRPHYQCHVVVITEPGLDCWRGSRPLEVSIAHNAAGSHVQGIEPGRRTDNDGRRDLVEHLANFRVCQPGVARHVHRPCQPGHVHDDERVGTALDDGRHDAPAVYAGVGDRRGQLGNGVAKLGDREGAILGVHQSLGVQERVVQEQTQQRLLRPCPCFLGCGVQVARSRPAIWRSGPTILSYIA